MSKNTNELKTCTPQKVDLALIAWFRPATIGFSVPVDPTMHAQGNTVQKRDATLPGRRPGSRSWAKIDI